MSYVTVRKQPPTPAAARRASTQQPSRVPGHVHSATNATSQPTFQGVGPLQNHFERDANAVAEEVVQHWATDPGSKSVSPSDSSNRGGPDIGEKYFESAGHPISADLRRKLQGAFSNETLSAAKLHFGPEADAATKALGAHALTVGHHMAFSSRGPRMSTPLGLGNLAHELRHTEQPHNQIRRTTPFRYADKIISGEFTLSVREAASMTLMMLDAIFEYLAEQEEHLGGLPDHVYISRRHIACAIVSKDSSRLGLAEAYNCYELLDEMESQGPAADVLTSPTQSEIDAQVLAANVSANPYQSVDTSHLDDTGKQVFHESISEDLAEMEDMSHPKKAALEETELQHDPTWLRRSGRKLIKKAGEKADAVTATANEALEEMNDVLGARFAALTNGELTAMLDGLRAQAKSVRKDYKEIANWFKDMVPAVASYARECKKNTDHAVADFESVISDAGIPAKVTRDVILVLAGAAIGVGGAGSALFSIGRVASAFTKVGIKVWHVDLLAGGLANWSTNYAPQLRAPTGKSGTQRAAALQGDILDLWVEMTNQHTPIIEVGDALADNEIRAADLALDWERANSTTTAPDFWKANAKKFTSISQLTSMIENAMISLGPVSDLPEPAVIKSQSPSMTRIGQDLWILWLAEEAQESDLEPIVIANVLSGLGVIGGHKEVEEYFELRAHYYVREYGEVKGYGPVAQGPVMWPTSAHNIPDDVKIESDARLGFDLNTDVSYANRAASAPSLMGAGDIASDEFFKSIKARAETEAAKIREDGNSAFRALTEAAAFLQ